MDPVAAPLPPPSPPRYDPVRPPFSAGAVISRSVSLWWKNVLRFAVLALFLYVPIFVIGVGAFFVIPNGLRLQQPDGQSPFDPARVFGFLSVGGALTIVVACIQMGALTYGAVQGIAGREIRIGAMLRVGLRRAWVLFVAAIAMALMVSAGLVLLLVPGIMIGCAASVAIPAAVAERKGPIEAIRRSFALTRGSRWAVLGAFLVTALIAWCTSLIFNVLAQLAGNGGVVVHGFAILLVVVANLLVSALPTIVPAVAYHDLRVAKEGVDTSELVKVFE
jgi:hypothetical protein